MPAKILQNRKVEGGAQHAGPRNFYISWVQAAPGGDKHGPPACAGLFRLKLSALQEDFRKRPIHSVVASAPGQQQAGALVVSGGDSDWTDFVALLTASYALANTDGSGELAQVLKLIEQAGDGAANARAVWAAEIEPCFARNFRIAGHKLGQLHFCHWLTKDKELIATTPPKARERDVYEAVARLLEHEPVGCGLCRD
ncbi:hypothetical protein [Piscinibacter sp.]|uniref:hypothetical protein n=1 Tax=Piscinibacter sp. TaxID=1903157 RepID=UPI002B80FFDF|nr:hypothetical protein [Albitalea sp.]HUG22825.1 hypothetical protein [Albitalea sp.]